MSKSQSSHFGHPSVTLTLFALATLLCGCQKPDPYVKLDDAFTRFEAALQGPITQAEFAEHVNVVKTEWNSMADKLETVGAFKEEIAKKAWERLDYSCQTDDFSQADISRAETSVFDLRMYLNRLRAKQGGAK